MRCAEKDAALSLASCALLLSADIRMPYPRSLQELTTASSSKGANPAKRPVPAPCLCEAQLKRAEDLGLQAKDTSKMVEHLSADN